MPIKTTRKITPGITAAMACLAIVLLTPAAQAQQSRTIYGSDGRVSGRTHTDSQGSTVIYGSDGKVQSRTSTGSDGTVTIYDSAGRRVGTVTTTKPVSK